LDPIVFITFVVLESIARAGGRGGTGVVGGIPPSYQVVGKTLNLRRQNMDLDRKEKIKWLSDID
jgi:hypothetical protein